MYFSSSLSFKRCIFIYHNAKIKDFGEWHILTAAGRADQQVKVLTLVIEYRCLKVMKTLLVRKKMYVTEKKTGGKMLVRKYCLLARQRLFVRKKTAF